MEPIMKFLEDDEDVTMHSAADVDALAAALSRQIEESSSSAPQPTDSNTVISQGMNHNQYFHEWLNSSKDGNANLHSQHGQNGLPQAECGSSEQEQPLPSSDRQQHDADALCSQEVSQSPFQPKQGDDVGQGVMQPSKPSQLQKIPQNSAQHVQESEKTPNSEREAQLSKLQHMNQQGTTSEQGSKGKPVPFGRLLPIITPQLDKEKAMQLKSLYTKLKKKVIPKDEFIRQMRGIVGDQMVKMAVMKLLAQEEANQHRTQGTTQQPSSNGHVGAISQKAQDGHRPDSHGIQQNQMVASSLNPSIQVVRLQGLTKHQQRHLHFSSPSIPTYGTSVGNINNYSGVSTTAGKLQRPDPLMRQGSLNQNLNVTGKTKFDRAHPVTDANRMHTGSSGHMNASQRQSAPWQPATTSDHVTSTFVKQKPIEQGNEQQQKTQSSMSHCISSGEIQPRTVPGALRDDALEKEAGNVSYQDSTFPPYSAVTPTLSAHQESQMSNLRTPSMSQPVGNSNRIVPKKPIIGQKKPLEASSPPLSSKKQKVSGGFLDQSIEQLNDVTAISGVNLSEEEEQLLSGSTDDNRVSEASRRVVQEEEERLILQRVPLQKKLEGIMLKCGARSISNDVERCLSLCVEERLRKLIRDLVRLSKQRNDIEKPKHRTIITSDVRQQILLMNQKSHEEWEKKQAEIESLRKLTGPDSNPAADDEKEKEEGRGKGNKANKQEGDKMRTTAANVAARAAVGGDDMQSKWQLMAEQKRQKREVSSETASSSQPSRDAYPKAASFPGRTATASLQSERLSSSAGGVTPGSVRMIGRAQATISPTKVDRSISAKDVIAVLQREPQMAKSPLLYRLYNKMRHAAPL